MSIHLIVDSCCDLPLDYVTNEDMLSVIGMPVEIDGMDYFDDLGKTVSHDDLYAKLRAGIMPTTAQINTYRFAELFEDKAKSHDVVIYLGFSSGMSGTYQNALSSIEMVKEKYPDADIRVLDSKSASIGLGLLTRKLVDMIHDGKTAEDIINWTEENKMKANHWFAVDDLNYLKNGGRVTPTEAAIGTLLSVKPILIVNHEGKLKPYFKVKGRKKSMKFLVDKFKEHYRDSDYDQLIIGHGNVADDALKLKEMLKEHISEEKIMVSELSATIASHVGPGMLAISFMGGIRENK